MDGTGPIRITVLGAALLTTMVSCGGGGDSGATATAPAPTASGASSPPVTSGAPTGPSTTASPSPATPRFAAQIKRVQRSTLRYSWRSGCPVPVSGLRLIEMTYWGMDRTSHEGGRLVVNARVASDVVKVFRRLYEQRYPIRRMELVDVYKGSDFDSIEANNTSAFNCRPATGSSSWSQHAYGLAIDINPCENPYVSSSGKVAHKDCVKFRDRSRRDPGVIHRGDKVVRAFASIGWGWGGAWSGVKDYQHFSSTGR